MLKQILIGLGILLVLGCADVSKENQLQTGCSEGSESTPENVYVPPAPTPAPSTPDTTAPTISSASPPSGATSISVSSDITITFSEAMDSSTINTTNITLRDGSANAVGGVVTYSSNVATFNPSNDLNHNINYTVTVGTGVKDIAGNAMGSNSSWSFTTITIWSGTKQMGTASNEAALGITSDSSGNIYVTGYTHGALDGNTYAGSTDLILVKYNSSGEKQWTRQFGTSSGDVGRGVTTDSAGNIYVTGDTGGGLDGNANAGITDIFVVKYNSAGVRQWTRQFGTSSGDVAHSITSDSAGNVYVTGYTSGDLDGTNAGSEDIFVAKYNSAGVRQWTKQLGTSGYDRGNAITSDSSGNIYVTGYTHGDLDGNTNTGTSDIFITKYNTSGTKQWTRQLGTSGSEMGHGATCDSSGNVYVTGNTSAGLDENTSAGMGDIFITKYNTLGTKQWTQQIGTSTIDIGYGIASDSSNNVFVTGYTLGGLDGNTNRGGFDYFVIKYNSSGNKQWTKQKGSFGSDIGYSITTDLNGNIFVAGDTLGDLDGNTNAGSNDLFVVKYDSDGNKK